MKVLIHDYAGHPFQVQLSRALAARGHEVIHAFATSLQTPRGELAGKKSDPATLRLRPVEMDHDYARFKYSFLRRRRMEICYGARVAKLIRDERPEVVLSANTPTETQRPMVRATRRTGGRFFFWVQDVYSLAVEKLLSKRSRALGRLVGAYYRRLDGAQFRASAGVVAITEDFVPLLVREFGVDERRVKVVPNWAPLESLPVTAKANGWSFVHGLADKFVFLYSGTLGMKHNPALLLELACRHEADAAFRLVVISEGPGADWLRAEVTRRRLRNVIQLGYQPFEMMPEVLAAGDVLIGVLEEDAGVFSVPSKILSYLCAQRPILLAAPSVNLATRTVAAHGAGLTVPPNDTDAFLAAAHRLRSDREFAAEMSRYGRAYAEAHFDIGEIAGRFETILGLESKGRPVAAEAVETSPRPRPLATDRVGEATLSLTR